MDSNKAAILLVVCILLLFHGAQGVDCNACDRPCGRFNLECLAKKNGCLAMARTFAGVVNPVIQACANYADRVDATGRIAAAVDLLVEKGLYTRKDVDGVSIRWCEYLGPFANGMAPEPDKILLHSKFMRAVPPDDCPGILAALIGHEMYHVKQWRDWNADGFRCRYAKELAAFRGFGRGNSVEHDAYEFEDGIAQRIPSCLPSPTTQLDAIIKNAYCRVLQRGVDTGGAKAWRGFLQSGHTVKDFIKSLVLSEEFANRFVTNQSCNGAIRSVYHALLARDVDEGAGKYWCNVLLQSGLGAVVDGIQGSDEYKGKAGDDRVPDDGSCL